MMWSRPSTSDPKNGKRKQYFSARRVARKTRRGVVKTLKGDVSLWCGPSDSRKVSVTSSAENVEKAVTDDWELSFQVGGDVIANKCKQEPKATLKAVDAAGPAGTPEAFQPLVEAQASHPDTCDEVTEEALETSLIFQNDVIEGDNLSTTWNLSVLAEHSANRFNFEEQCIDYMNLHFDCDVCINCKCSTCETCIHKEDGTCEHCHFCVTNVDTDDDDDDHDTSHDDNGDCASSSDEDTELFEVDASELLSETEKLNENMQNDIVKVVLEHNVPQVVVGDLLSFFRKYNVGKFPKSPKTLLKTPAVTKVRPVPPGEYWHRGIRDDLLKYIEVTSSSKVLISFSIDGVPLAKSSGSSLYPICCSFNNSKNVIVAGVYCGIGKPHDFNDFMKDFVDELNDIVENGIECNGNHVACEVYLGIFDAVAKADVLNVVGHSGFFSCCKCTVEGKKIYNRTSFLKTNCALRTDRSFIEQDQEDHHIGGTILTQLKTFQPVSNVPLDYMHLVLLGSFRKMVYMWLGGKSKVRQAPPVASLISALLVALAMWVPFDFTRKTRSLKFVKRFKATEWRLLLLYVGVVVFRGTLPKHLYEHFLVLHVIMIILSSPEFLQKHSSYADSLTKYFIDTFIVVYGKQYVSYNIHNMAHLVADCEKHGTVDNFSAFIYENFYQKLQKMVRKGEKPLQQIARRYEELKAKVACRKPPAIGFSGLHTNGPLPPWCTNPQFSSYSMPGRNRLNLSEANNCCSLDDESIVIVQNFATLASGKGKVVVGRKFLSKTDLFTFPCQSSTFGIVFVSKLSALMSWPVESVKRKCFRLPFENGFAVFPLLHSDFHNN